MTLLSLPAEILLLILPHLSESSIYALRLTNSVLRTLIDEHPAIVYRTIAYSNGYLWKPTASDTGIEAGAGGREVTWTDAGLERELRTVLTEQKGVFERFQNVADWKDFVCRRKRIEKNWKLGIYKKVWLFPSTRRVWRIKVDHYRPDKPLLIVSSDDGVIQAFDIDRGASAGGMKSVWKVEGLGDRPHVEVSQGYIISSVGDTFLIWRRRDIRPTLEPGSERQESVQTSNADGSHAFASEGMYVLHECWKPPTPGRCFKARFPYLAVGTPYHIYTYHLERCTITETITHTTPVRNDYIELSRQHIFLCTLPNIYIYKRGLDPSVSMEERMMGLGTSRGEDWDALHHWNGHVVATSGLGTVLWNPNVGEVEGEFNQELSVCLDTGGHIWNLSVENGRCVFILEFAREDQQWYHFHFSFELKGRWKSLEEFKNLDVRLTMLGGGAMGPREISRVEMSSDAIFTTMPTRKFRDNDQTRALFQDATFWWKSMEYEDLCPAFEEEDRVRSFAELRTKDVSNQRDEESGEEDGKEDEFWKRPTQQGVPWDALCADAIMVHDFS